MTTTAPVAGAVITDAEFAWVSGFLRTRTGIEMRPGKECIVVGRLAKRLRHYGLSTFAEYARLLEDPGHAQEIPVAVDLLTTNETYFFREAQHFDHIRELAVAARERRDTFRVWSAASSSGEEAYSLAMTLAGAVGSDGWEIVGTDISQRMVQTAQRGLYPLAAAEKVPHRLRTAFCLRGRDEYEGSFLVSREIRQRVAFHRANLLADLSVLGTFDVILLRNVMIYFSGDTKRELIARLEPMLRPGGTLIVGRSETLHGLGTSFVMTTPSIYRTAAR